MIVEFTYDPLLHKKASIFNLRSFIAEVKLDVKCFKFHLHPLGALKTIKFSTCEAQLNLLCHFEKCTQKRKRITLAKLIKSFFRL